MGRIGLKVAVAVALVSLLGCDEKKGESTSTTTTTTTAPATTPTPTPAETKPAETTAATGGAVTDADRAQAKEIFATRCTPCHGPGGEGNGPASAGLTPPPRNFTDAAWQASVTDEHIEKIITYGGAAVGKSPAMPPNPDLADKPVIKALREHVRSLKK